MFNTPILFIVFNRLDTTQKVFSTIKDIQPKQLFIAADGPRDERPGENKKCADVRKVLLDAIDWECEVKTLFRDKNLGCGKGPVEAINWFFEHVEKGIILEDDCLPSKTFFTFCETMLTAYENDKQIMHVGGNNFQLSKIGNEDYYFSKLPHSWGWATWKRAWMLNDFYLDNFHFDDNAKYFGIKSIDDYWKEIFYSTKKELHSHVWDYQWTHCVFFNDGLCILPQYNLVTNIGFGEDSSHTINSNDYLASLKRHVYNFTLMEGIKYDPQPDINFHMIFAWVKINKEVENHSVAQILKMLLYSIKVKLFKKNNEF